MHEEIASFVPDQLDSIAGMSAEAVPTIVGVFVETARERVAALVAAIEAGDWVLVGGLAHSLKGSSSSIGARRLSQIAGDIELQVSAAQPTTGALVEAHRAALLPEFERARVSVENYVAGMDLPPRTQ